MKDLAYRICSVLFCRSVPWCRRAGLASVVVVGLTTGLLWARPHAVRADGSPLTDIMFVSPDTKDTTSIAWGDADGDGDLDLAVGNLDQVNQLYRNDGDGGFTVEDIGGLARDTTSVAWGDVDGDGDLDLAVGNSLQANQLYWNDGRGSFTVEDIGGSTTDTTSVAWGDADGDGDLDLAVGNLGDINQLYRNEGSAGFTVEDVGPVSSNTYSVAWGDADTDGDLDLAVGNSLRQVSQLYRNDGGGHFTVENLDAASDPKEVDTRSVTWGDVDGDGDLDLAAGNAEDFNQLYRNDGDGGFTVEDIGGLARDTTSVAWGDVDGDGDLDLAVGNSLQANQLYHNHGNGYFTPQDLGTDTKDTADVAWGDVDGDGDLDLAVGNSEINQIYRNDDSERFTIVDVGNPAEDTASVAWGDMDGDNDLDLAVGNSEINQLYRNNSSDGFTVQDVGGPARDTTSVAWGDADGDGDLDLAVGNDGDANQLYRNDGNGSFTVKDIGGSARDTTSVAWGDVDGDGDLDLAVGNSDVNQIYRNSGNGSFLPEDLGTDARWTRSVAWGDMDGDGDLDLAVGNSDQVNQLYHNDGSGHFVLENLETDTKDTMAVAWGDVDGDGDLDLAVGNYGDVNQLYCNDGTGNMVLEYPGINTGDTRSVSWGDADGDGDLDLAVGLDGQINQLYLNQRPAPPHHPAQATSMALNLHSDLTQTFSGDMAAALAPANFYAVPGIRQNGIIPVTYTLFNPANRPMHAVSASYSLDGGGHWITALATPDTLTEPLGTVSVVNYRSGDPALPIPIGADDESTISSTLVITKAQRITDLDVWLDIAHTRAEDLSVVLISPNETVVELFNHVGGKGDDFRETVLDDQAPITITAGTPPFTGRFRPEGRLADLDGETISGTWTLVVTDDYLLDDEGTLLAWGITLNSGSPTYYLGDGMLPTAIPDNGTVTTTLVISAVEPIIDVNVWLNIAHDNAADLDVELVSPAGTVVELFSDVGSFGHDFTNTILDDQAIRSVTVITPGMAPFSGLFRPEGRLADLDGQSANGTWVLRVSDDTSGNLGTITNWGIWLQTAGGGTHVYRWDVFGSGFFGQSDNVVLRLEAHPLPSHRSPTGTQRYVHETPGPYQRPFVSAQTYPFRVRGTQVQVISETVTATVPISGALVYRLPAGHSSGGSPLADGSSIPFRTDNQGYLQGRGQIGIGDRLLALVPVHSAVVYDGALMFDGLDDHVIIDPLHNAPITATTISFWMRSEDTTGDGTPLSYDVPGDSAEFLITNYNDLTIFRGDSHTSTGISVTDGEWHHIAVTWRSDDGEVKLYKDGEAVYTGTLAAGTTILPGGSVTLGRDQNGAGFFAGYLDEVRVWNVVRTEAQVQDDIFRFLSGSETGLVAYWPFDDPTKPALDQSGNGNDGVLEGATWVGDSWGGYTVYHTSSQPTTEGLAAFSVTELGVQVLTVTAGYPLVLFDVDVSLEWDAHNDPIYLQQLASDLHRASEYLYDFTDGQMALGHVNVFQNADDWGFSHIVVHATNRLRPFAAQGGIVISPTVDPDHDDFIYDVGQVHIGATWNRYGTPGQNLGLDWPLILGHELGHYLLFLDETYLGLNEDSLLIPVDTCTGSAMGDVYVPDNTEFVADQNHWNTNCADTLTNRTLGRTEWETIQLWYPWLIGPPATNPGPRLMPFDLTTVTILDPITPTNAFQDPTFYLDYQDQEVSSSEARAFLLREDKFVLDLGSPVGGQNRVLARGAQSGDRLCVFDQPQYQYGCGIIESGDERLQLVKDDMWTPVIQLTPVSSMTFGIQVAALPATLTLRARLFPEYGFGGEVITLTHVGQAYSGTFHLPYPALAGHVHVWADEGAIGVDSRRESIVAYTVSGNPGLSRGFSGLSRGFSGLSRGFSGLSRGFGGLSRGFGGLSRGFSGLSRGFGGLSRGFGGLSRGFGAPLVSPNGQMIFFIANPSIFDEGELYAVQNMAGLPTLPVGKTAVGQGYHLVASPNVTRVITGSISFQYMESDALIEGVSEDELTIHFWDGRGWHALDTVRDTTYNLASAPSQGDGVYVLLAGVTIPHITSVAPPTAKNNVPTFLEITGSYFLSPVEVALLGPTATITLPLSSVSPYAISAEVPLGLPAHEYQVIAINHNQPGGPAISPVPGIFAVYDPATACFYDFFESGASQWQQGGDWSIVTLPNGDQAMTDSPAGPYKSAGDYDGKAITYTTYITSQSFSVDGCPSPMLTFRHDYAIAQVGTSRDIGRVEISTDGGATWTELGRYSSPVVETQSLRTADVMSSEWTDVKWESVRISLKEYTGTVHLRFGLEVDRFLSDKGWVLDDVMVKAGGVIFLPTILRGE